MNSRAALCATLSVLAGLAHPCAPGAAAQDAPRPREAPVLKGRDFGSSLERLRWDERKQAAVEAGGGEAARAAGAAAEEGEEVVRVETSLVVCDVLVLDRRGVAVRGLTRDDFVVTEDGRPQEIATFALGDGAAVPRTIVLVIDYSQSLRPFIANSVAAAKSLVDQLGPRDRMAVVTDDVELLIDFTGDRAALKAGLEALGAKAAAGLGPPYRFGRSRQYSALLAALRELFDEEELRPIVIFQTEGDEVARLRGSGVPPFRPSRPPPGMSAERFEAWERSRPARLAEFSLADVYARAERSRVTVYPVIPGVRRVGLAPGEEAGRLRAMREQYDRSLPPPPLTAYAKFMSEEIFNYLAAETPRMQAALVGLAELTGGQAEFLEEPAQAAGIYSRILSDINGRYVIGYHPADRGRGGGRRRVRVEVRNHPEYAVRGRKSYFAPGPEY